MSRHNPIDAEQITKIDQALEITGGDKRAAAATIGMPYMSLFNAVYNRDELKRWRGVKAGQPPPDAQVASTREKSPVNPAAIVEHGEKALAIGWEALGVTDPDTIQLMQQFEGFVGVSLQKPLDVGHGGTLFSYAQASARVKDLGERLKNCKKEDEPRLHKMWVDAHEIMRRCKDSIDSGTKLRLMVENQRKGGKGKKHRSPGFGRGKTAIQVEGGKVQILQDN